MSWTRRGGIERRCFPRGRLHAYHARVSSVEKTSAHEARIRSRAPFVRENVCIDCRTLLGPKEQCDGGRRHRVVELGNRAGRSMLLNEVWGPPSVRRRAKQLAKAGGGGIGIGSVFEGCGGCDGCGGVSLDGEVLLVIGAILIVAVAVVALGWFVLKIIEWVRAYLNRPKPNGGVVRPASIGRKPGPCGVVVGKTNMLAPATCMACVAWALDLRSKRFLGTDLMLRDAETCGFDVKLDDGTTARIPSGRVRIEGPHTRVDRDDATTVKQFVQALAPVDDPEDEGLDPFPYEVADEIIVKPGCRVRLFGDFEREADVDASSNYRGASVILVPSGVPALRIEHA
jgi:hypothetical protein